MLTRSLLPLALLASTALALSTRHSTSTLEDTLSSLGDSPNSDQCENQCNPLLAVALGCYDTAGDDEAAFMQCACNGSFQTSLDSCAGCLGEDAPAKAQCVALSPRSVTEMLTHGDGAEFAALCAATSASSGVSSATSASSTGSAAASAASSASSALSSGSSVLSSLASSASSAVSSASSAAASARSTSASGTVSGSAPSASASGDSAAAIGVRAAGGAAALGAVAVTMLV
ncbi:hypothetical protein JCM10449v2_003433 [Rhodotorula kratochvilovae]